MLGTYLDSVRQKKPLIHNITNYVTVNDVANAILAVCASPIMADEESEVEEITSICAGLNINIGTLNKRTVKSMLLAGKKANDLGHKVLLDPVGAGASSLRTQTALELVKNIHFDVIRGNMSEIKTLALGSGTTKGVDADANDAVTCETLSSCIDFAKAFAKKIGCTVAITGETDIVTNGEKTFVIHNGTKQMSSITGTGCILSGIATAFICASENTLEAAASAVCAMGLAGEIGFSRLQKGEGNSSLRNRIIDALYDMTGERLDIGAKYETY